MRKAVIIYRIFPRKLHRRSKRQPRQSPRLTLVRALARAELSGAKVSSFRLITRSGAMKISPSLLPTVAASSATIVGRDAGTDLAVLKIDDEEIAKTLQPAEILETAEIKAGNIVLAVGRTSAEAGATASFGVINRVSGAWRTWHGDEIERLIALDLSIFLGFSGGALINGGRQNSGREHFRLRARNGFDDSFGNR